MLSKLLVAVTTQKQGALFLHGMMQKKTDIGMIQKICRRNGTPIECQRHLARLRVLLMTPLSVHPRKKIEGAHLVLPKFGLPRQTLIDRTMLLNQTRSNLHFNTH
jgi:hypothetical protein